MSGQICGTVSLKFVLSLQISPNITPVFFNIKYTKFAKVAENNLFPTAKCVWQ